MTPWIWRSQAFWLPQEWYIAIGRWVRAWRGYIGRVGREVGEGGVPDGEGVEGAGDAGAQVVGRLAGPSPSAASWNRRRGSDQSCRM